MYTRETKRENVKLYFEILKGIYVDAWCRRSENGPLLQSLLCPDFFEFDLNGKIRTQRRPLTLFHNQSVLSAAISVNLVANIGLKEPSFSF